MTEEFNYAIMKENGKYYMYCCGYEWIKYFIFKANSEQPYIKTMNMKINLDPDMIEELHKVMAA